MSTLIYNNILIELTKTNAFVQEPIRSRDGVDIVAIKYRIDVTGIFNPASTSYVETGITGPVHFPGQPPAMTYNVLRGYLMEPRRTLIFAWGNTEVIRSPRPGFLVDAAGGPNVVGINVIPMGDSKTFLVRIVIETVIDECVMAFGDHFIQSNRWESTHSLDSRFFTTIETRGLAIFNMDVIKGFQDGIDFSPDHFRSACLPGIPAGFRREHLNVSVDSMGRYLTYHVVDIQMPYSLGTRFTKGQPDPNELTPAALGVEGFKGTFFSVVPPTQKGIFTIASKINIVGIVIQAWGGPFASRRNLLMFAYRVAVDRLELDPAVGPPDPKQPNVMVRTVEIQESLDRAEISLKVEAMRAPADGGLGIGPLVQKLLGVDSLRRGFPGDADGGLPGGFNPQPPNDLNTRGVWNGEIIAQKLQQSCDKKYLNNFCVANNGLPLDNYLLCPPVFTASVKAELIKQKPIRTKNDSPGVRTNVQIDKKVYTEKNNKAVPPSGTKLPPQSPGGPPPSPGLLLKAEVMTLGASLTTMVVDWTVESIGGKPKYPAPEPPSDRATLMAMCIGSIAVDHYTDAVSPIYTMNGSYEYVFSEPFDHKQDSIFMGISPYTEVTLEEASIDPSQQADDVIFDS